MCPTFFLTTIYYKSYSYYFVLAIQELGTLNMKKVATLSVESCAKQNELENLYSTAEDMGNINLTDSIVVNIKEKLDHSATSDTSDCYIYRVPKNVRELNEAAYTPLLVSIGPYHYGERRLQPMEEFKMSYCKKFIESTNISVENYVEHVKLYEERARKCYEANLNITSLDFVTMILVDACFILEFMLRSQYTKLRQADDDLPSMQLKRIHINHDLVLLENQLPYFILDSIYRLDHPRFRTLWKEIYPNLSDLVSSFFNKYAQHDVPRIFKRPIMHFTDFIRTLHEPKRNNWDNENYEDSKFIVSATQLYDAGVKFQMVHEKCLLDVDFENQTLLIPRFELNDDKESLFRNLVALELHHYPYDTFIIDYFVFMDTLIDTSYDISLLVQNGVLNRTGDYWGAAHSFNNFCAGITHYNATSYLNPIHRKLNEHCKEPTHTLVATLKHDYFSTPFKTASTIAAILLLMLTLVSTVCSIIPIL